MSITWIELGGKRVAPVKGNADSCGTKYRDDGSRVECSFAGVNCDAPRTSNDDFACLAHGTNKFFITEDQLPEYLAAKLLGEVE